MAIALFFLLCGQCTVCVVREHNTPIFRTTGLESSSLGVYPNISTRSDIDFSSSITAQGQTIRMIDIVTVFANITRSAYMVAVENNSLLNAKYSVYALAHEDIIINGFRIQKGELRLWEKPFPQLLAITFNESYYQVRLRQVSSLNDIDDEDRINDTAIYGTFDMISIAIAGVPAVLASLGVNIAVLVFTKSQRVQEGLPNDI